jgi:hypothetical protein
MHSGATKGDKSMKILSAGDFFLLVVCGSVILLGLDLNLMAQTSSATSPAKSINMYAYPRSGQSPEKQSKDESECYASSKQQTGVDPQAPAPAGKSAEQKAAEQKAAADSAQAPKGGRVKGAARGAAGGAAIGAINDDAGDGAAAGAVAGTMVGGAKQRKANAAAKQQASANTAAAQQKEDEQLKQANAANLDSFKRAFAACMDARGYSVK